MPTTRSQACSAQPAEQVTSPRDYHTPRRMGDHPTPRRVLRSRQGNAGVTQVKEVHRLLRLWETHRVQILQSLTAKIRDVKHVKLSTCPKK